MKNLFVVFILLLPLIAPAQSPHVLQVSGVVVATDSLIPMPYVTVYRQSDLRGTYSDHHGYFTLPIRSGDTLHFHCIGLESSIYIIPEDTTLRTLSIVQLMETDTLTTMSVTIYPYPKPYELQREILALDLPGDDYVEFNRSDGEARNYDGLFDLAEQSAGREQALLNARLTSGLVVGGNLLDGAAWKKFVRSLKDD
ncbi:MAG: carboxypeptidase-like regulatory domain-containing protein [Flavobacteriales bacterium]